LRHGPLSRWIQSIRISSTRDLLLNTHINLLSFHIEERKNEYILVNKQLYKDFIFPQQPTGPTIKTSNKICISWFHPPFKINNIVINTTFCIIMQS